MLLLERISERRFVGSWELLWHLGKMYKYMRLPKITQRLSKTKTSRLHSGVLCHQENRTDFSADGFAVCEFVGKTMTAGPSIQVRASQYS